MPNTVTLHSPPADRSPRCGEIYIRPGGDTYMVVYVGAYFLVSLRGGSYWDAKDAGSLDDLNLAGFTHYVGSITIEVGE